MRMNRILIAAMLAALGPGCAIQGDADLEALGDAMSPLDPLDVPEPRLERVEPAPVPEAAPLPGNSGIWWVEQYITFGSAQKMSCVPLP